MGQRSLAHSCFQIADFTAPQARRGLLDARPQVAPIGVEREIKQFGRLLLSGDRLQD